MTESKTTKKSPEEWALLLMAYAVSGGGAEKMTQAVKEIWIQGFEEGRTFENDNR